MCPAVVVVETHKPYRQVVMWFRRCDKEFEEQMFVPLSMKAIDIYCNYSEFWQRADSCQGLALDQKIEKADVSIQNKSYKGLTAGRFTPQRANDLKLNLVSTRFTLHSLVDRDVWLTEAKWHEVIWKLVMWGIQWADLSIILYVWC